MNKEILKGFLMMTMLAMAKTDYEKKLLEMFYELFQNFSSKTYEIRVKKGRNDYKRIFISQVGIMIRDYEFDGKSRRIADLKELKWVFKQDKLIMPYIKRKLKRELFCIWRDALKKVPENELVDYIKEKCAKWLILTNLNNKNNN